MLRPAVETVVVDVIEQTRRVAISGGPFG